MTTGPALECLPTPPCCPWVRTLVLLRAPGNACLGSEAKCGNVSACDVIPSHPLACILLFTYGWQVFIGNLTTSQLCPGLRVTWLLWVPASACPLGVQWCFQGGWSWNLMVGSRDPLLALLFTGLCDGQASWASLLQEKGTKQPQPQPIFTGL